MPVDCSKPTSSLTQQEQTLCTCKQATDAMVKTLETYETLSLNYTNDKTAYDREKKRHDEWRNMSGEFANWSTRKQQLIDERKTWNNCIAWTGVYGHDYWCRGDTGFAKQSGAGQHGCALGWGRGECQRDDGQVIEQLRREGYNNAEPNIPGVPQPPVFKSENTIQCCSQIFSNINVSGAPTEFNNINQNCSQQINDALNAPAPTSAPTSAPTLEVDEGDKSNQTPIIIIIIIVVLLLILSSSSISSLFLMNTGEE